MYLRMRRYGGLGAAAAVQPGTLVYVTHADDPAGSPCPPEYPNCVNTGVYDPRKYQGYPGEQNQYAGLSEMFKDAERRKLPTYRARSLAEALEIFSGPAPAKAPAPTPRQTPVVPVIGPPTLRVESGGGYQAPPETRVSRTTTTIIPGTPASPSTPMVVSGGSPGSWDDGGDDEMPAIQTASVAGDGDITLPLLVGGGLLLGALFMGSGGSRRRR